MRYRPLGASGIQASVIGFGSWAIGGFQWGGTDEAAAVDAIRAAMDMGVTLIDTAPVYGFGLSEEIVGRAVEGRRDQAVLATKCGLLWDQQEGTYMMGEGDRSVYKLLRRDTIMREVELSLKRLRTDRIDLYQTHWQDPTTPIEETMGTLLDLKEQGKIRAIGVSNVTTEHLDEYRKFGVVDSDQESYSMVNRRIESNLVPYCREKEIAILAYSPLVMGLLSGKMSPDREFPEGDIRRGSPTFSRDNVTRINVMLDKMRPIADRHRVSIAQLVIAWTAAQPGITHVLCGMRNPAQAEENCRAGDVVLSEDEIWAMNETVAG